MNTIVPLLIEAERYFAHHDLDRAAELYKHAGRVDDTSPLPNVGFARIALALGRPAEAAALLDFVIAAHPRSAEALTIRGVVEDARGQPEAALPWFEKAIRAAPTYGLAQFNLGRCQAQLERWQDARRSLESAAHLLPGDVSVSCALGIAYFRDGDTHQALATLGACVQRAPDHLESLVALVDVLVEAGQASLADELLENGVGRFPRAAILRSKRAALALRRGDVALASVEAERTCALSPADEEAWLFAATVDAMQLRFREAELKLRTLVGRAPHSWRAHYQLGVIYDALRARRPAQTAYRNAIAAGPAAWEPTNNLATLLLEEGSPASLDEARGLYERSLELAPPTERSQVHYNLALVLVKTGDVAAARRHAREATRLARQGSDLAAASLRLVAACQ